MLILAHDPVEACGDAAFQAAHGFLGRLVLGEFAAVVEAAAVAVVPDLLQGDEVDGAVELPVSGAGQPVAGVLAAGDFDRRDAGVAGEVGLATKAGDASGLGQNTGGQDDRVPQVGDKHGHRKII